VLPTKVLALSKLKLTDGVVARAVLSPGKNEAVLWDAEVGGFGLRIRPGGCTWIVSYRPVGAGRSANMRRLKLGTPATIPTAAEARKLARITLGKVAAGGDPAAERAEKKRRDLARVSDLLDRYERDLTRRGYVNRKVVMAGLRARLKPHASKDIGDVSGADLARVMEGLERAGQAGAAEDFRSRCRAFLTWCVVKAKVIATNPLAGHRRERATRADRIAKAQHGRALSDSELRKVWKAAVSTTTFGRLIRFYILTGCRRGEGAGLTWAMIDRAKGAINLPPTFTKQGRGHVVPIASALAKVLDACPMDARSDLVFPSLRTGGRIGGWTKFVSALNKESGVDFDLHDLRRTFRTGLSRVGIDSEVAELALGHARSDLEAIYNRDEAFAVLQQAFTKWTAHVTEITSSATTQRRSGEPTHGAEREPPRGRKSQPALKELEMIVVDDLRRQGLRGQQLRTEAHKLLTQEGIFSENRPVSPESIMRSYQRTKRERKDRPTG
jgi:integrase